MPAPQLPPDLLDITRIDDGTGAEGIVYRATRGGTPVAVKVLTHTAPDTVARFLRARALVTGAEFRHPNLVTISEIGGPPDWPAFYLVMEHLPGGTLAARAEDFREPTSAARIVRQLADGVRHLHAQRWLHRDLKPANVLFAADGRPVICDFGLARDLADQQTTRVSAPGSGTPNYMSPEQSRGLKYADRPADIWSLGVILLELLTGLVPLQTDPKDWRPSRYNRAVTGALDQVVLGCLQHTPARRYTAAELVKALDAVLAGGWPAPPTSVPIPDYPRFTRGRIALNVVLLPGGGDGTTRYTFPEGIVCTSTKDRHIVPELLADTTEDWLRWRKQDTARRGIPFENRDQPRVVFAGTGLTDGEHEKLYPLILRTAVTNYFATQVTHFAIHQFARDRRTIREAFAGEHNDFEGSELANPLAINLSVVTKDGHIFMTRRGKLVGGNAEFNDRHRVPAVSGTGHPTIDANPEGHFDPWKAGIREAREEVLGDYDLKPEEVTFFGLARTGVTMFPFLFGEIRYPGTRDEYISERIVHANDVYAKEGRPFTVEAVTEWIKELYHVYGPEPDRRLLSGPSHTGIFSLYQSLIYEYPARIAEINRLLAADPDPGRTSS
ncbi:MAG TPA: serine/threonine-protein kinase [Gemmata sp.]